MIDVEEFLAAHPSIVKGGSKAGSCSGLKNSDEEPTGKAGVVSDDASYTPSSDDLASATATSPSSWESSESSQSHVRADRSVVRKKGGKHPYHPPTHAVSVSSPYTSGFGGSLSDEDAGWSKPSRNHGGRRNSVHGGNRWNRNQGRRKSRYHTGEPVVRVPDDPKDADACREVALGLLDASARSSLGLRKKLVSKGYDETVAANVVDRLVQLGLVDDEAYAQSVIRSCLSRQLGARGALQELRRKDVDRETATMQVRLAQEQGAFEDAAWELGRRVAAKTKGLDRQVRMRRFWSAGGRKGHSPDTLLNVFQELFTDD